MMDARDRAAYERVAAKRRHLSHLAVFAVVSGLLTMIWAGGGRGFYWPVFVLAGWGLHLVVCGFALPARPISREQLAAEVLRTPAGVGR